MSKLAKKPVILPEGVEFVQTNDIVKIKGPKGELSLTLHRKVKVEHADRKLLVMIHDKADRRQKALQGTFWSLLNNMVQGVTKGFEKRLEIVGVGYRASIAGGKLNLTLGYSHPIELPIEKGLEVKVEKNNIIVSGVDKQQVGEFAAWVRSQRKPEPYKGKGIKYSDEVIRRKAGKVVKASGG